MGSTAKIAFDKNKADVDQLWVIHEGFAGAGAGRKRDVEVLNRTAMVFITACWESYVEDIAKESFEFMLNSVSQANDIPVKVRNFATKPIFDQKDSTKVWAIADKGWQALLIAHKEEALKKWLGNFNTPKCAQVEALFEELLGIKDISSGWHWQRMQNQRAKDKLDEYVTIRGNIAHRTAHKSAVYKRWGTGYLKHIENIISCMERDIFDHLHAVTGKKPW